LEEITSITTASDQTITCGISELSAKPSLTWIGPDNIEISDTDSNDYIIDQGRYVVGSQVSTLTIKTAKFASLSSGDVFKCKLKSGFYPIDSPEVVKETVLALLTLGLHKYLI
jgi:hypothetical protein